MTSPPLGGPPRPHSATVEDAEARVNRSSAGRSNPNQAHRRRRLEGRSARTSAARGAHARRRRSCPSKLERSLDTSALDTPVKMISTFAVPGERHRVRVVVAADGVLTRASPRRQSPTGLALAPEGEGRQDRGGRGLQPHRRVHRPRPAVADARRASPARPATWARRCSFEFKDIDIHNLLRVIAEVSQEEHRRRRRRERARSPSACATSPGTRRSSSSCARKGLGKEEIGQHHPRRAAEDPRGGGAGPREERKESLRSQEDLVVQLIPVNYATADRHGPTG